MSARNGMLAALGLGAVLCTGGQPTAAAELVSFAFAPRTGKEIAYKTTETHRYDIPGKKSVQRTTGSQAILVEKTDAGGSTVKVTIGDSRLEEDGMVKPVPAIEVMTGRHYRLRAGKDGRIQEVAGLSELAKGVQDSFDNPRIREVMAGLFTEDKLKERFTGEWNNRIDTFTGRKASVGESWYGTQEIYMPFIGSVTLYRKATLAGLEKKKGRKTAHLVYSWFSDPSALNEAEQKAFEEGRKKLGNVTDLSRQGMGVLGQGEAWVEPDTMTVLNETQLLRGAFSGLGGGSGKDQSAEGGTVELERTVVGTVK